MKKLSYILPKNNAHFYDKRTNYDGTLKIAQFTLFSLAMRPKPKKTTVSLVPAP